MDVTSILLILAVLILTAAFVLQPFIGKQKRLNLAAGEVVENDLDHTRSALLAEKERALTSLQELDFDHSLHKIPEDQYPEQRAALLQQAATVFKQLEDLGFAQDAKPLRSVEKPPTAGSGYDELEDLIARRRAVKKDKSSGFCPHCGKPVSDNDRFCPKCGTTIHPE